jgi:hypothetical protein
MELPQTLHAQLYLLAYDRQRRCFRFDHRDSRFAKWRFGYALRAAMLTDLYLGGCIEDREGMAYPSNAPSPADPVLNGVLKNVSGQDWKQLIARGGSVATRVVRAQLEASGWIQDNQRKRFGMFTSGDIRIYDEDTVSFLAERVTEGLRNFLHDRRADPRPLALGMIAVQAQLTPVCSFVENRSQRERLRELTFVAIEPIAVLHQAIQDRMADERASAAWS